MKQTIEIEVPEGKKVVLRDNKIVFEDIKPQLPKTWEEFCENNFKTQSDWYIDSVSNIINYSFISERHPNIDKNCIPSKKRQKHILPLCNYIN